MNSFAPPNIRNFVVVGHASSGKTLLTEAMLRCAGAISRMGTIADGTTASDYHTSERQRQISVQASLLRATWQDRVFNIIDSPGYLDFMSEGLGALRVGDFALVVIHGVDGVCVGTDRAWEFASRFGIPKIIAINQLDRESAKFDTVLAQARAHYGRHVFPLSVPIDSGPGFQRELDVLRSEIVTYATDGSGRYTEEKATGVWEEKVKALHRDLIAEIAESDDTLLARYFDKDGLTEEEFRSGIHAAIQRELFIPVFGVSAEKNVGVARLMDFIAKYGSSPADRKKVDAVDAGGNAIQVGLDDPDPVLYVWKTMSEPHFGELSFFRIYAGSVSSGQDLQNTDRQVNERLGQLYVVNGHDRTPVPSLGAGEIGAAVRLRDTHTGNTLCSIKRQVSLPKVEYPKPTIQAALSLEAKGEEDRLASGLAALHEEDPTFQFHVDSELHQTLLSAQGEIHLEVIAEKLRRRHNTHVQLKEPRIPFRETLRGKADSKYRHKKQTGGAGQFAEVWMRIEALPRGSGVEFIQSLTGQNVDRTFVPSVEKGVRQACAEGVIAGCRVTDVRVEFYDGKMHPVDSKDIAFQIAGYFAFKEAFMNAHPCLLEPLHQVSIRVPEEFVGRVLGDLSSRRGRIQGVGSEGSLQVITAEVPAKELYRYASILRSLTGGQGLHSEAFSHYEEMPRDQESKVVEHWKKHRSTPHEE